MILFKNLPIGATFRVFDDAFTVYMKIDESQYLGEHKQAIVFNVVVVEGHPHSLPAGSREYFHANVSTEE